MSTPTTTVGKASIVFNTVMAARRPQNLVVPTTKPTGTPTPHARTVETSAILMERSVMSKTSGSPPRISSTPRRRPSAKKSKGSYEIVYPNTPMNQKLCVHSLTP